MGCCEHHDFAWALIEQFDAAKVACSGLIANDAARREGIEDWTVFVGTPEVQKMYGSLEFNRYITQQSRVTRSARP